MNNLAISINDFLKRNQLPYIHYSYDNEDVFKVGIYGHFQTMVLLIYVSKEDSTQYKMECSYLELVWYPNVTNDKQPHPGIKKIHTDNGMGFSLERKNIDNYDEQVFINDFDSLIEECDCYNGEKPLETLICDEWLSFIEDLTTITFSASKGNMPNAAETNSQIISSIVTEMGLTEKLELFRANDSKNIKYKSPYYPKDKESQSRYIRGLLRAIFSLEKIAYEENFKLVSNNILFMAMRGMGFSLDERQEMIANEFLPFSNFFPQTLCSNILASYLYLADDMNRADFLFESEGIIDESGIE